MKNFQYKCHSCDQIHVGMPAFGFDYPAEYLAIPEEERESRTWYWSDACVIDEKWFFIRAQLEVPVHDHDEPFTWGVWVSISRESLNLFQDTIETPNRHLEKPFFAWLTSVPYPYPKALLKARVHLRPYPTRPFLELEPTDHPLAIEQQQGISPDKAQEIAKELLHPQLPSETL